MSRRTTAALVVATVSATAIVVAAVSIGDRHGVAQSSCPAPGQGAAGRAAPPDDQRPIVMYGLGRGHSLGMSQYGARGAALLGCNAGQILATYYPGTRRVSRELTGPVHLWMLHDGRRATVTVEPDDGSGGRVVWRHRGERIAGQPTGTTWTVRRVGNRTQLLDARQKIRFDRATTGRQPLRAWHTDRVVDLRTYRAGNVVLQRRMKYDAIHFNVVGQHLRVRQNFVTNGAGTAMDKYLWGLAEIPPSWPQASLRAQAIAARTYAVRADRALWPTAADQFYGGHDPVRDSPSSPWRHAVDATSGRIVVDSAGRPIEALYTTSLGGWSEDARYVWGSGGQPYLRAVKDVAWTTASGEPNPRWSASFTYERFATEFGFDRVTGVSITGRGTSERLLGMRIDGVVDGTPITRYVSGWTARQRLGLPSPGFTIETR